MAVIRAFKAVRPAKEFASRVAALPYDVMNSDEARIMAEGNQHSFLHVDKAEIDLPKDINVYDSKVYEKAKDNLYKMIEDGIFIQDNKPLLYIYKLKMNEREQFGVVACASIDEYLDGKIKKHELTLEKKEQDRIRHVDICDANTGPIYLTYRSRQDIDTIVSDWVKNHSPEYDFVAEDGINHTIWVVDDLSVVEKLSDAFRLVPALYIADGHHRSASAVKVGLKRRDENPNSDACAEFNFFLTVVFPSNQLNIMDYNRLVKDLNGLSESEFFQKVQKNFIVENLKQVDEYKPCEKFTWGMYMNGDWYKLTARDELIDTKDVINVLDASVLQNYLLEPILGITDPRTSKKIDFVGGIRGLSEIKRRVDSGEMKLAFSMYPTSMDELLNIADEDKTMPPKSTWFEPKLRSGLFIHLLQDNK